MACTALRDAGVEVQAPPVLVTTLRGWAADARLRAPLSSPEFRSAGLRLMEPAVEDNHP
jgi:hypothetical protein